MAGPGGAPGGPALAQWPAFVFSSDSSESRTYWLFSILNITQTKNNDSVPGWMLKSFHARIGYISSYFRRSIVLNTLISPIKIHFKTYIMLINKALIVWIKIHFWQLLYQLVKLLVSVRIWMAAVLVLAASSIYPGVYTWAVVLPKEHIYIIMLNYCKMNYSLTNRAFENCGKVWVSTLFVS